jgi:hypothetical protein
MIDRSEPDLRFDAHGRMVRAMAGRGWRQETILPAPAPRRALAALLRALAARLVPRTVPDDAPVTTACEAPASRLTGWEWRQPKGRESLVTADGRGRCTR